MHLRKTKLAVAIGFAMIEMASAHAQDLRISVTGTNIKRTDTETAAPVETITREDIMASGLQTISDVVRQITANNNGTIGPSFTNGTSASGSAVSLRGLGPTNTLVLLNGRRLANFGLADDSHATYVDLQQIPFDAVERIEILKDGASAIYGSDAVAGVVNVILRQQFAGLTVTATGGTNYDSEGSQGKGAVTWGYGDLTKDRYNVFVIVDGQKQNAIPATAGRKYAGTNDLRFMGLPDARPGNPESVGGPGSLLGNVFPAGTGSPLQSLPGDCAPSNRDSAGLCRWEPKNYIDLLPQIERFNVFGRGAFNLTESIQGYLEASYFHVDTNTRFFPPPWFGTWADAMGNILTTRGISLPVGHPDNPFNATAQNAAILYADAGIGTRTASYETGTQRYLAGVKGNAAQWDFDVAALYIRSDTDVTMRGLLTYDGLLRGVAGTGPYGYYRVGAAAPMNDPAVYAWIAPPRSYSTLSENAIFDARASRDIYRLPGGSAALAVGYELRREELSNPGLPGAENGNLVGISYAATSGSRTVNALYAELFAPIARSLEATAAVRYDHYSDFGSTVNPKLGVKWTALPSLVLRGTWETAFRAPTLYETGNAYSASAPRLVDPVRCPVTDAAADCRGRPIPSLLKGASLEPETSTTYTAGLIWEPTPGLSATLDYWNVQTRDQITAPDLQAVVNDPAAFTSTVVARDTNNLPGIPDSGSILYVSTAYQNARRVKTDGFDLGVRWRQPLADLGTLTSELQWTHVFNFQQTFGGTTYEFAGTQGPYDVSSGAGTPKDRANLILSWTRGPMTATGTIRYVSGYQSIKWQGAEAVDGTNCILPPLMAPPCRVASFTTLDLSVQYAGFKHWQVFGSIINVFNRLAPFDPAAAYGGVNYNYNWAYSGATGTQFNLGFRYTFE